MMLSDIGTSELKSFIKQQRKDLTHLKWLSKHFKSNDNTDSGSQVEIFHFAVLNAIVDPFNQKNSVCHVAQICAE